jgi:DNA repair protein RadC
MEKTKEQKFPDSKMSEIKIKYSNWKKYAEMPTVSCSKDAATLLRSGWSDRIEHIEEFVLLCLNRANKVLGYSHICTGGISGCLVDPKVIFQVALKANAVNIILSHSHPSGNKHPSESDRRLTKKVKSAAKLLDVAVLDHIILTTDDYFSFADEGIL